MGAEAGGGAGAGWGEVKCPGVAVWLLLVSHSSSWERVTGQWGSSETGRWDHSPGSVWTHHTRATLAHTRATLGPGHVTKIMSHLHTSLPALPALGTALFRVTWGHGDRAPDAMIAPYLA